MRSGQVPLVGDDEAVGPGGEEEGDEVVEEQELGDVVGRGEGLDDKLVGRGVLGQDAHHRHHLPLPDVPAAYHKQCGTAVKHETGGLSPSPPASVGCTCGSPNALRHGRPTPDSFNRGASNAVNANTVTVLDLVPTRP